MSWKKKKDDSMSLVGIVPDEFGSSFILERLKTIKNC